MGLKFNPYYLSSFSAFTLLVGSFDPRIPVPNMTYNVFGGTLNLALCLQDKREDYQNYVLQFCTVMNTIVRTVITDKPGLLCLGLDYCVCFACLS